MKSSSRVLLLPFVILPLLLLLLALPLGAQTITTRTLDSTGDVGRFTSQAIVNGNPAISYYDDTNGDLKYVRALNASGTSWGTPVTVDSTGDVGTYTSLAVVNGNPAISYYDNTNDDLKYVRALNASGTSWGTPVTLDSTGDVGQYTSLAVVNGNPAISYSDETNDDLKYVRALDASGTSWGTPVTLDSTDSVGGSASLAVVNGNPAISYSDETNDDLKYVRALDASGTSWGTPVTLDGTDGVGVGGFTSLAVVNGNPAISYYDDTNNDLRYVRALNAGGTSWGTPVTVDSTGNVGTFTSLAVVNGNPAISYRDNTNANLKYVRALNASGTSWGTPVTLDSTGNVGFYTSLAVVNGNPAISYFDDTNDDLKWATIVPSSTLGNISTRLQVGTSDRVMIAGFIVQGSFPKRVLIRAAGPSLTQLGVPNALANPRLELHHPTEGIIGMNDNWQTTQIGGVIASDQVAEIGNSGLVPGNSLEPAIIATLTQGGYTVIVQGVNGGTGVGIVEAYDLDLTSGSLLANISTRGFVQTGDNIMIGGFIIVTQPTRVIIRAIGSSLTQFGVPDALANPTLELRNSNGALLTENNDWQDNPVQAAELIAAGLAPTNTLESGIATTLPPGAYTVLLAGLKNGTGNALVEVYGLP